MSRPRSRTRRGGGAPLTGLWWPPWWPVAARAAPPRPPPPARRPSVGGEFARQSPAAVELGGRVVQCGVRRAGRAGHVDGVRGGVAEGDVHRDRHDLPDREPGIDGDVQLRRILGPGHPAHRRRPGRRVRLGGHQQHDQGDHREPGLRHPGELRQQHPDDRHPAREPRRDHVFRRSGQARTERGGLRPAGAVRRGDREGRDEHRRHPRPRSARRTPSPTCWARSPAGRPTPAWST